jgi:hypothetical protein
VRRRRRKVEKLAAPVACNGTETDCVPLSEKTTTPVGIPDADGVTTVVKVTAWLLLEGFGEELIAVGVEAGLTFCEIVLEVLSVKFRSPS